MNRYYKHPAYSVGTVTGPLLKTELGGVPFAKAEAGGLSSFPVGGGKRRGFSWTDRETDVFLDLWAKRKESGEREPPLYDFLTREMARLGFQKSPEQCKTRIHTLKRAYRESGYRFEDGRKYFRYNKRLKEILGTGKHDHHRNWHPDVSEVVSSGGEPTGAGVISTPVGEPAALAEQYKVSPSVVDIVDDEGDETILQVMTSCESSSASLAAPADTRSHDSHMHVAHQVSASRNDGMDENMVQESAKVLQDRVGEIGRTAASEYADTFDEDFAYASVGQELDEHRRGRGHGFEFDEPGYVKSSVVESFISSFEKLQNEQAEVEKMRLELELKKCDVERARLEMEERQRREDREHQYRMMQLILGTINHTGVSTQSIANLMSNKDGSGIRSVESLGRARHDPGISAPNSL